MTPNIFVWSIFRCGLMFYTVVSGVNSVQFVLSGLSMRLLSFVHVCNCCIYDCVYDLTVFCWCV